MLPEEALMPKVRDVMVTNVVDAAKQMIQQEKGPLPLVEGDRVVGMVTDRDIIARVVAEGRDPTGVRPEPA
jgi:CBS domain-containing protein